MGIRLTLLGPDAKLLESGAADWLWPAAERALLEMALARQYFLRRITRVAGDDPGSRSPP